MIVKHEIIPFNDFWLDCDTEIMYSILTSVDERFRVLAYRNDYTYMKLSALTPHHIAFNEIRMLPDISNLRNKYIHYIEMKKIQDISQGIGQIRQYLLDGYYVMVGVDLYDWVPENMCFRKHHVEHYTLLNGYDSDKKLFYTMETDHEKYREFQVKEETLANAMESVSTLKYHIIVFEISEKLMNDNELYSMKELRNNAKLIVRSIRSLKGHEYWVFHPMDYQKLFYRDMTVMYLMQINCRMKANVLLFAHLSEEKSEIYRELEMKAKELESGWIEVRRAISKLYFKQDAGQRMIEQNATIQVLLSRECIMWKRFLQITKRDKRICIEKNNNEK